MPKPAPPTGDPPPPTPPPMVLVDRRVRYVDEFREIIKEIGELPLEQSLARILENLPVGKDDGETGSIKYWATVREIARYREDVQRRVLDIVRERRASPRPSTAVRKEPFPDGVKASLYGDLWDGIEDLCFSPVADSPSVTRLSLKVCWPPGHPLISCSTAASIASCHNCFLVLYGSYSPEFYEPGFYLVYNAWANSVAFVPPLFRVDPSSHCDIGAEVAVLCCGKEGDYVLAELLLRTDARSLLPTNKATLFMWGSSGGGWTQTEVVLPLPLPVAADESEEEDKTMTTTPTRSFCAHMVFAVSSSSLCWVDLLTGILVYNHIDSRQFHFIPLPEECAMLPGEERPEEYRSMCCISRQSLKFVSMESCGDNYGDLVLTTWTLSRPLSPMNWKWKKDAVPSFRIRDLWDDPVYKDELKLQPIVPTCPVISTREPGIIYLSVTHYEYNHSDQWLETRAVYMLSLNMERCRVESAYKLPPDENGIIIQPRIFTSNFSSYLNKTREWELIHATRDKGTRGEELAGEGESRSNPSTPYTVGVGLGMLKLSRGRLSARQVIPAPCTAIGSSRKTRASSSYPVGLQAVLDHAG